MNTTHHSRTRSGKHKPRKPAKTGAKKSTPPDARPTARMPARRGEKAPPRSWAYAEANAPRVDRERTGAARKPAAAPSVGRVYGGENNVTLPTGEKASDAAPKENERLKQPRSEPSAPARR